MRNRYMLSCIGGCISVDELSSLTRQFQKSESYALGVRRCLPKGALVHLKRGLVPIEKVKVNDEVLTTKGYKLVTDWFDQGERDLIRIITQDGDFTCTPNHRMPVLNSINEYQWVEAGKLQPGQRLVSSRTPIEGVKTKLPRLPELDKDVVLPDLDEVLAWRIGHQHVALKQIPFSDIPTGHRDLLEQIRVGQYFGMNRVPDWILQATSSVRLAYIAGIVDNRSIGDENVLHAEDGDFVKDVQKVLYSCGIESRLSCSQDGTYRLTLMTNRSIRMVNRIPQLIRRFKVIENIGDDDTPLYPVEVIRVEPAGTGHTYDITVDGPNEQEGVHEFFVNGYLSHNTAEMVIFDPDDYEILFAKYGLNGFYQQSEIDHHIHIGSELEKLGIKPAWFDKLTEMFQKTGKAGREGLYHRHLSNNSILFPSKPKLEYLQLLVKILRYEGEPGLLNLEEMQRRRPNAEVVNPCGEILLDSYQTCNLTTVNLMQFINEDIVGFPILNRPALLEAQRLSVRAGLRMTLVTLELPHWDDKQKRDRLIGTSLTGIKDAMDALNFTKEQEYQLIKELGDVARLEAVRYAKEIRVPAPLLATTIKPEGSLSQVAGGVSPGLHLSHSPFYIRRIRINSHDAMVSVIKQANWRMNPEVGTPGATYEEKMANARTYVVDFPVSSHTKKTKYQTNIEEQLETYFSYQANYADHNCSNTVSVNPDEWDKLPQIIFDNWDRYLGITFIPLDGGNYELAPYEECSKEAFLQLKARMAPFDAKLLESFDRKVYVNDADETESTVTIEADETLKSDCPGGICPIR